MGNIVVLPSETRRKIRYQIIRTTTKEYDGGNAQYPAICIVDAETGLMIRPTYLETYILPKFTNGNSMVTIDAEARIVTRLMNYILLEEKIDGIHEIDRGVLARFEESLKHKDMDTLVSRDTWERYVDLLYDFLEAYYTQHQDEVDFQYDPKEFEKTKLRRNDNTGRLENIRSKQTFVVPPPPKQRKMRYLPYNLLEFFEEEVWMFEPDLLFATKLQSRSGIREGGIVNITKENIHVPDVGPIVINIKEEADFVKEHKGKTKIGSIKKYRKQEVYPKFNHEIRRVYREHLQREEQKFKRLGKVWSPTDSGPLFTNKYGNPLTVHTYNERMKKLWKEHFVPDFEAYCIATGQYEINKALIDAYKKEWIGCHSLRHWFTMYLKCVEKLDDVQVANWRGDTNMTSYFTYMHTNQDILENFEKVSFYFQMDVLLAIQDGNALRYLEGQEKHGF